MVIQESAEMYLETILVLSQQKPYVRSLDVAEAMGFSKPSVSRAVSLLKESGYLLMDKESNFLTLTPQGKALAEKIYERHTVLTRMLVALGVDEETAMQDACKIEHDLSDASFEAIKNHIHKVMKG